MTMLRYVRQPIETSHDGQYCSPDCFFYSANKRSPICWLGRGHERIEKGRRTARCLKLEEKNDE